MRMLPGGVQFTQMRMLPGVDCACLLRDEPFTAFRACSEDRRKYLKRMVDRYWAADRPGKSELLAEMEAVTSLHRKSLIRLLHEPTLDRQRRTGQRGRVYLSET